MAHKIYLKFDLLPCQLDHMLSYIWNGNTYCGLIQNIFLYPYSANKVAVKIWPHRAQDFLIRFPHFGSRNDIVTSGANGPPCRKPQTNPDWFHRFFASQVLSEMSLKFLPGARR